MRTWFNRVVSRFLCWRGLHDFEETEILGEQKTLLYADRVCKRCGLRRVRTSGYKWVRPLTLTFQWEREDRENGTVVYRGPVR